MVDRLVWWWHWFPPSHHEESHETSQEVADVLETLHVGIHSFSQIPEEEEWALAKALYDILKKVEADMDEDDPCVSAYNMLTDLELVVAEYNEILRQLIVNDVYEQMVEHSVTSSDLILRDIAEIITWSKTISVYQAKLPEQSSCNQKSEQCLWSERNSSSLPKSIDYREKGLVTTVKDQGNCGSCWAFSAAGALEAQLAKKAGRLVELSPQNLVDCDKKNNGCDGGFADFAFEHVQGHGYVFPEEDYPYVGQKQRCRDWNNKPSAVPVQCRGFEWIPEGDERALAEALHEVGPLSVQIDASDKTIPFYKSGVYYNPACNSDTLSHAMLLVGYGETATGQKYWTVKNSWGKGWGENGYIRIARNRNNHCGIASVASYPLL